MPNIDVVTTDKLGKAIAVNPVTKLLDVQVSSDADNVLEFGNDNGLKVSPALQSGAPVWQELTLISGLYHGFASNNPVVSTHFQIGKDSDGFIWLKGSVHNGSGASIAANTYFTEIPSDYHLAGYGRSASAYQLSNCVVNNGVAGNTTVAYLKMQYAPAGTQKFAVSIALASGMGFSIPPQVIGFALYP